MLAKLGGHQKLYIIARQSASRSRTYSFWLHPIQTNDSKDESKEERREAQRGKQEEERGGKEEQGGGESSSSPLQGAGGSERQEEARNKSSQQVLRPAMLDCLMPLEQHAFICKAFNISEICTNTSAIQVSVQVQERRAAILPLAGVC